VLFHLAHAATIELVCAHLLRHLSVRLLGDLFDVDHAASFVFAHGWLLALRTTAFFQLGEVRSRLVMLLFVVHLERLLDYLFVLSHVCRLIVVVFFGVIDAGCIFCHVKFLSTVNYPSKWGLSP